VKLEGDEVTELLNRWTEFFGQTPVTVRTVLTTALDAEPDLMNALCGVAPELQQRPAPRVLSRWLLRFENCLIVAGDRTYRLSRVKNTVEGALWRLKLVEEVAAVA
jgi:hypothetical protein